MLNKQLQVTEDKKELIEKIKIYKELYYWPHNQIILKTFLDL